ncbi:hypothetical protein C8R44DRAFT_726511 [Mycena epipterygia]|nr:hypothetical protein C8R44DRAFT_726511 [Mycena epipterygia]
MEGTVPASLRAFSGSHRLCTSSPTQSAALRSRSPTGVLRALAHGFPHPEHICLIYRYGAPAPSNCLVHAGHPPPPPSAFHAVHARAAPRAQRAGTVKTAVPWVQRLHGRVPRLRCGRAAPRRADTQCRVFLAPWASPCPRLRVVGLAPRKLWCRVGNEWELQDSRADRGGYSG